MDEQKRRFPPTVLIGDGALLLCALCGLTVCFLSLYTGRPAMEWADVSVLARCAADETLFLTCAALFALLSLTVWSLPRFRGGLAGGLAAVCLLTVWRMWDEVVSGAAFTCKTIAGLFAARVDWGKTFPYESALSLTRAAAHTRLFLLLTLAVLALALGWAVVRARRWWLVLALTLPPLLPGLVADLYPRWPPFLALSACWCAMMLTDLCRWAAPSGRGKLTLAVLPAVAAVLVAIMLLFPQEGYTRPQWALDAETVFHNTVNRLPGFFSQWEGPFGSGTVTYVGAAGEEDLASAGPLNYSGRTVLRVNSDYSGRMYLRGASLAVYEDGVWKALPEGTYEEYAPPDTPKACPLYFPAMLGQGDSTPYTVTVDNVGAVGTCVYAPYFLMPLDVDETGVLPVEDSYLAWRRGQRSFTMTFVDRHPVFTVISSGGTHVVAGVGGWSDSAAAAYRDYAYAHYLDVPEELREALYEMIGQALAYPVERTFEDVMFYEIEYAHLVAAWMEASFEYDPDTPAAPEGTDPVLWFLTESRRGYCMHYTSAATLLLRTMGVPARYVSGFTVESVPGQTVDVPDRAAHAWVEVWVDGFGWYPVEVTPAAAFAWYEEGAVPSELPSAPVEESETPEPTPTPSQKPEPSDLPSQTPGETDAPVEDSFAFTLPGWAKWIALALGGAALLWLGQFLLKKHRAARMSGPDPNRAALACYGYLVSMERWGGRISPRARELAEKAKFSQHILTQAEVKELQVLVDWERTRLCVVMGPAMRLASRCWWGMPKPPAVLRRVPPLGQRDEDKKPPNP